MNHSVISIVSREKKYYFNSMHDKIQMLFHLWSISENVNNHLFFSNLSIFFLFSNILNKIYFLQIISLSSQSNLILSLSNYNIQTHN